MAGVEYCHSLESTGTTYTVIMYSQILKHLLSSFSVVFLHFGTLNFKAL